MNAKQTYRSAVIGCGRIGSEFDTQPKKNLALSHAGAYFVQPRMKLIAGCDADSGKLRKFKDCWQSVATYTNYKDMLEKERIDILSICTPVHTHYPILEFATEFPLRAIYCEKPIAESLAYSKRMIDLCREKKILLIVNHQRRFDPFFRELRQKIHEGDLGQLQHVNCFYSRGILNTGIHIVDLFHFLFGPIAWVEARESRNPSHFDDDPNLDGVIQFCSGLTVSLNGCDDAQFLIFEIDILGSRGRVRLGKEIEYFRAKRSANLLQKNELVRETKAAFKNSYGMLSLTEGLKHIVDCLENNTELLSSGEDGHYSLAIIDAMHRSVKSGKKVYFKA